MLCPCLQVLWEDGGQSQLGDGHRQQKDLLRDLQHWDRVQMQQQEQAVEIQQAVQRRLQTDTRLRPSVTEGLRLEKGHVGNPSKCR